MHEELRALLGDLAEPRSERVAGRDFHFGSIDGRPVVLVLSGIGKVAAAATTALLLDRFEVDALLFTGVAGGLGRGVAVGDVVLARELLQHDLDASPIFPRYEVPLDRPLPLRRRRRAHAGARARLHRRARARGARRER